MATVTATKPVVERPRKPFRWGPVIVIVGTVVLLIFAFLELAPFVLTIANSFKCQAAVQNAAGAIIPVPPGISCVDANGVRIPFQQTVNGETFPPTTDGYNLVIYQKFARWLINNIFLSGVGT